MSRIKKSIIVLLILFISVFMVRFGQTYMINNRNFYAIEADSVQDAKDQLQSMDLTQRRDFGTKDFYGVYIPNTSFVLTYDERVYYDQGFYIVYKGNYKPVFCIDPLKTAWSVTNEDNLDEINNHNFSLLTSKEQEEVAKLVEATQSLYNGTLNPEYLVAGQLLIWEAIGSTLDSYSYNIQGEMDEIRVAAEELDFSTLAKGTTSGGDDDLVYYDTDGQDLVGTTDPDTTDPDTTDPDTTDPDVVEPQDGDIVVNKTADVDSGSVVQNGQVVTYTVKVSNTSDEVRDIVFQDDLSDSNMVVMSDTPLYINGQATDYTVSDMQTGITLENLAANDSVEISYAVTIELNEDYTEGDVITNTAEACIVDSEVCAEDMETIGGTNESGIGVQKTITDENGDNDGIAQKGEKLTFTIKVNNGGEIEQAPIVTDALNDPNIKYDTTAPINIDGEESSYTVGDLGGAGVVLPTMAVGSTVTLTFEAEANDEFVFSSKEMKITNITTVKANGDEIGAEGEIPVGGFEGEKTVVDEDGDNVAEAGEVLTYTIQIENYSSEVTDITVKDTMSKTYITPDENSVVITPKQVTNPSTVTVSSLENGMTIKDVAPGESITITYTAKVNSDLEIHEGNNHISNNVQICQGDDLCIDDSASITINPDQPIIDGGDKSIIKNITDGNKDGVAEPGEAITFDVLISNGSESDDTFVVKDELSDPNIKYTLENSLTEVPGGRGEFTDPSTPTVGDLKEGIEIEVDANSHFEFKFDAKVKSPLEDMTANTITNQIEACTDEGCADGGGSIELGGAKAFEVNKTVVDNNNDGVVEEKETFQYSIEVKNIANSIGDFWLIDSVGNINVDIDFSQTLGIEKSDDAIVVEPSNPLLSDMLVSSSDLVQDKIGKGIHVTNVAPSESVTFTFNGVGRDEMISGEYVLTNIAKVVWEDEEGSIGSDEDTANIFTKDDGGDLIEDPSIKKETSDESEDNIAQNGEELTYHITVSNPTSSEVEMIITDNFDDKNIDYDMSDIFTIQGDAEAEGDTLQDLHDGVLVSVPANSTSIITYKGTVKNPAEDTSAIYDYNTVEYCVDDTCNDSISYIPREGMTDFNIIKTVYDATGKQITTAVDGQIVTYEIKIENTGNEPTGEFTIRDYIDDSMINYLNQKVDIVNQEGITIVSSNTNALFNTQVTMPSLEVGESVSFEFNAEVVINESTNENVFITNIAEACMENEDEKPTCKSDDASLTTDPTDKPVIPGEVQIVKQVIQEDETDEIGRPGEGLTYRIYVSNSNNEAQTVTIRDELSDPNLTYDENSLITITPDSGLSYTIGDLKTGFEYTIPAKSNVLFEFEASIAAEDDFDETQSELTNVVTACDEDGNCSDGGGHITLPDSLGFSVEKDVLVEGVDTTIAELGDHLQYNFTIRNTKNSTVNELTIVDRITQYIDVPVEDIEIVDENGNNVSTTPENPTTEDLLSAGIKVNEAIEPGEKLLFSYDAIITSDLNGTDVNHLSNAVGVMSSDTSITRGSSIEYKNNLYGFSTATVTLDPTYPIVDGLSVVKKVQDNSGNSIAEEGEALTYRVFITNESDSPKNLSLHDLGDPNGNVDYSGSTLAVIPELTSIPTLEELLNGTATLEIPAMSTIELVYSGVVTDPLNDPSAGYVYNNIEVCDSTECTEGATALPLIPTSGFDIQKDVSVVGKDVTTEAVEVGDVLDYTIRITNNRNTDIENINLKDVADGNIIFGPTDVFEVVDNNGNSVEVTPDNSMASLMSEDGITINSIPSGGYIEITFSSLPLGESILTLDYNHLTNMAYGCTEINNKSQSQVNGDGICAGDYATVTLDENEPVTEGVSVIKLMTEENSNGLAEPGEVLHFKIFVNNNSENNETVTVTDLLDDPNIDYNLSDQVIVTPDTLSTIPSSPVIGNLTSGLKLKMGPSQIALLEYDAKVSNPLNDPIQTEVKNNVLACDEDGNCDDGGGQIGLERLKGFDVKKTVAINGVDAVTPEDYIVQNSDNIKYTITFTNNRNQDIEELYAYDIIDSHIIVDPTQLLDINGVQSAYTAAELFTAPGINLGPLAVGESITIEYDATAQADIETTAVSDKFTNGAIGCLSGIKTRGQSIDIIDNTCGFDTVTITTDPDGIDAGSLGIIKSLKQEDASNPELELGEKLTYTIYLYNGNTTTENLVVKDSLNDVNVDYPFSDPVVVTPEEYIYNPSNPTLGDLKDGITLRVPGQSYATVSYTASVKRELNDTTAESIKNVAEVCLEDGSECTDSSVEEKLPDNEHFVLTKVAYKDNKELTDTDIVDDGDIITYYIQVQNIGNVSINDLRIGDKQDDNLVSDLTDYLEIVPSQTTQEVTEAELVPTNPTLDDLFIDSLSEPGVVVPELGVGKKITFTYQAVVNVVDGTEKEAANVVLACEPNNPTKGLSSFDSINNQYCAVDHGKVNLLPGDHYGDIGVLKIVMDDDGDKYAAPGEELTYTVVINNATDQEYSYYVTDTPDASVNFDPSSEIQVTPSTIQTVPSNPTIADLDGSLKITIPAEQVAILQYTGTLKDTDLDPTYVYSTNTVQACRTTSTDECGEGDSRIPISPKEDIYVQKYVDTANETDLDADSIYDVVNNERLTYTINVTNSGNVEMDINVSDEFPNEFLRIPTLSTPLSITPMYETTPTSPTIGDLLSGNLIVKGVGAGESFNITYDAYIKNDLLINGEEYSGYIINDAQACQEVMDGICNTASAVVEYENPTDPNHPDMTILKKITDEKGNDDGIAQPGELLTFKFTVVNLKGSTSTFTINDKFADSNIDYEANTDDVTGDGVADSVMIHPLEKIGGTGVFVNSNSIVEDLKDDPNTADVEGVDVTLDSGQIIQFSFDAPVKEELSEEGKYNSHVTNEAVLTDEDGNQNNAEGIIELPSYTRMDVNKTYETDYYTDLDPNPSNEDKLYYVTAPGDSVSYTVEFQNIGLEPMTNFVIKDEINKTYYNYVPTISVTLVDSETGVSRLITLEELNDGYTYTGELAPNASLVASFDVQVNKNIETQTDDFLIPNTAMVCYDNTFTSDTTDEECKAAGTETPYNPTTPPTERPDLSFIVDKWIDDSIGNGDADGKLDPNEDIQMHILITNNTEDLEQFSPEGPSLDIDVTDKLTDENFIYNLSEPLKVYSLTPWNEITGEGTILDQPNPLLATIEDVPTNTDPLTIKVEDGETIEIIFNTKSTNKLK